MPRHTAAPPPPKRRKVSTIEEIPFDFEARADYLTGFHKRKLQRAKAAKERDAKKEREQKIELRKQLREQRKQDLENHVKAVNEALRKAEDVLHEDDDEKEKNDEMSGGTDNEEETAHVEALEGHEDEYIDEDKFTTVTVEPMALRSDEEEEEEESEEDEEITEDGVEVHSGTMTAKPKSKSTVNGDPDIAGEKKKRIWTKEKPEKTDKTKAKKVKKSKFRYESKSERKNNKNKARLKNKARAIERKEGARK